MLDIHKSGSCCSSGALSSQIGRSKRNSISLVISKDFLMCLRRATTFSAKPIFLRLAVTERCRVRSTGFPIEAGTCKMAKHCDMRAILTVLSSEDCRFLWQHPNGGSRMGAWSHSLQFVHNFLQFGTLVALLGPFCKRNFRCKMTRIVGTCGQVFEWPGSVELILYKPYTWAIRKFRRFLTRKFGNFGISGISESEFLKFWVSDRSGPFKHLWTSTLSPHLLSRHFDFPVPSRNSRRPGQPRPSFWSYAGPR